MTRNTSKKLAIRSRMQLTGENYLTASRNLSNLHEKVVTPWVELNTLLGGGFRKGSLYVIGSRPKVGKFTVSMALSTFLGGSQGQVLLANLETSMDGVFRSAAVYLNDSPQFTLTSEKERKYYVDDFLMKHLYLMVSKNVSLNHIRQILSTNARPLTALVVDYLQLFDGLFLNSQEGNRSAQIHHFCEELKALAIEFEIPIILFSQLNRMSEGDPEPRVADLRESSSVEQVADAVILLHRPGMTLDELQFLVAKNRHGATGEFTIPFVKGQIYPSPELTFPVGG